MTRLFLSILGLTALVLAAGCEQRLQDLGRPPTMTVADSTSESNAMSSIPLPQDLTARREADAASLWAAGRRSLLGDRRAKTSGDILTVVIEIDDQATVSASSSHDRSGSEEMTIGALLGIETLGPLAQVDLTPGVSTSAVGSATGSGSTSRNEKLTLRIAATVVGTQPNGVLKIQGSQEVRVNFELRELLVTGYVNPADITRQNEISYDKIASARISYGGRGRVSDVQQPRIGQQVTDMILPF